MADNNEYKYLDLLERKLDGQQRKVCCRTENTIVAAGAGSGKTQVLATRFAWLVMSENIDASRILTLTFTNKAASEMYVRIYSTLKFFADNENVPQKERNNAQKALDRFAEVHIQTLDSYCAGIVTQAANRYGIRPDFSAGTADCSREVKNMALPFVLKYRNDPAVLEFSDVGKIQEFAENIFAAAVLQYTSLADRPGVFTGMLGIQRKKIADAWNRMMTSSCSDGGNDALPLPVITEMIGTEYEMTDESKLHTEYFIKIQEAVDPENVPEFFNLINPDDIENKNSETVEMVRSVIDWLERFNFPQNKGYTNPMRSIVNGELNKKSAPLVNSIADYIINYKYIKRLYELLDEFFDEVNCAKRSSGKLSFKDVSELALRILTEQKDIRIQEKHAYSMIMIDEFQDNNGKNRDLLFLLAEKDGVYTTAGENAGDPDALHRELKKNIVSNKLFFVGDEKQSIYKFRGADVSVFNGLKKDLQEINPQSEPLLNMVYNYRSAPELISSFNMIFGGFLDSEEEKKAVFEVKTELPFEACYSRSAAAKSVDRETHEELPPAVLTKDNVKAHVCMLNEDEPFKTGVNDGTLMSKKEQLAYFIAEKIEEIYGKDKKYSSIAVLDRSRTDRKYLLRWLGRKGIPYTVDRHSSLFADAPVNDIYNFLRLCVYPSDVNAFTAYICSPFSGLSELSAETVLSVSLDEKDRNFVFVPFNREYESKIKSLLSESEYAKYCRAEEFYSKHGSLVSSRPLTETLSVLWYDCGYYYETLLNESVNLFAEQFDLLYEIARQADTEGKSASWFVDQLSIKKEKERASSFADDSDLDTADVEYPAEKGDAVQIMTIHKSKGLQFDHVFVYGCTDKEKSLRDERTFFSEETGISIKTESGKANYFFKEQKAAAAARELAEFRRIIYVAVTRAVKDVHIIGSWNLKEKNKSENDKAPSLMESVIKTYYPEAETDGKFALDAAVFKDGSPFDFLSIKPAEKSVLFNGLNDCTAAEELRAGIIRKAESVYKNVPSVPYSRPVLKRISPSDLETKLQSVQLHETASVPFMEINSIVESTAFAIKTDTSTDTAYTFSYADFGTLIHAYLEAQADNVPAEVFDPPASMFKNLPESDIQKLRIACGAMCISFMKSSMGMQLENAKAGKRFFRAEYGFKTCIDSYVVRGSIDLIFQNEDGTYTIVDYKTDQAINPELYYNQQACYRIAAAGLVHADISDIKCVLYYLRYNKAVDITEHTAGNISAELFAEFS